MRRIFGVVVLTMAVTAFIVTPVSAHVLKTDGSIGAVLHIKPDDNPIQGVPATYELSFRDSDGKFSLQECDCRITFVRDDTFFQSMQLTATSSLVSQNSVSLFEAGAYVIHVTGMPKASRGGFQGFTLKYTIQVGIPMANRIIPPLLWTGMAMFVALLLLAVYVMDYSDKQKEKVK